MNRPLTVLFLLGLCLAAVLFVAVAVGSVPVPWDSMVSLLVGGERHASAEDQKWAAIILLIRLPRVLGAALVGAGLATAGAALQAMLRNPMADPGILGVSGGAGLGAVL